MGLLDSFKNVLNYKTSEDVGAKELPRDVLDDLKKQNENNTNEHSHHYYKIGSHHEAEFQNMFSHLDDIMRSFFNAQPNFTIKFEDVEGLNADEQKDDNQSLRERMFDDNNKNDRAHHQIFSFPFHDRLPQYHPNEDLVLDGLDSGQQFLDEILNDNSQTPPYNGSSEIHRDPVFGFSLFPFFKNDFIPDEQTNVSTAYKYSTVTKKMNPDGSIVTETKRRDSDGNEEVVIMRSIGDQTHAITNKRNHKGEEEKTEQLINMDQDDLAKFEERWTHQHKGPRSNIIVPGPHSAADKQSWSNLFSSWWKPKL